MIANRSMWAAWTLAILVLAAVGCRGGTPMETSSRPTRPIQAVMADHTPRFMAMDGVVAVGQGALEDGTPTIQIFIQSRDQALMKRLPSRLEGHPVEVVVAGEIKAMPEGGR